MRSRPSATMSSVIARALLWSLVILHVALMVSLLIAGWTILRSPGNAYTEIQRLAGIWLVAVLLVLALLGVVVGGFVLWLYPDPTTRDKPKIRVYCAGLGDLDYSLIERLFAECTDVKLYPVTAGFSGALVFDAESRHRGGLDEMRSVVKLDGCDSVRTELKCYHEYIENRMAGAPHLIAVQCGQSDPRGGLRFEYASLRGRTRTLEQYWSSHDPVGVIETVFSKQLLGNLLEASTSAPRRRLYYEDYLLGLRDWRRIVLAVQELDLIDLGADSFVFEGQTYPNPLLVAEPWFTRGEGPQRHCQVEYDTLAAIVHGDLNARNILIDENENVFLVDFVKSGWGHILKDFCRLETEIKYCLTRLESEDDVARAVEWEQRALHLTDGATRVRLQHLAEVPPDDLGPNSFATDGIRELRKQMLYSVGPLVKSGAGAEQYYVGLLHYALDVLRYEQCSRWSKLHALITAALFCRALG